MEREEIIQNVERERELLEENINNLINDKIKYIPIANNKLMPFGWRKSAKGRTVWRIVEEVISQNLEKYHYEYGFEFVKSAPSEVGVYDFEFNLGSDKKSYVNIKSAVIDGKTNKDDISKAIGLIDFLKENSDCNIYIATFLIEFTQDMKIKLERCIVFPTTWIPDVYVNPSNNGNLQSSKYRNLNEGVQRTNEEFLARLEQANAIAQMGGKTKLQNKLVKELENNKSLDELAKSYQISIDLITELTQ